MSHFHTSHPCEESHRHFSLNVCYRVNGSAFLISEHAQPTHNMSEHTLRNGEHCSLNVPGFSRAGYLSPLQDMHNVTYSWCQLTHACCTQRLVSSRRSRLHPPGWSLTQYSHTVPATALTLCMCIQSLGSYYAWITLTVHDLHISMYVRAQHPAMSRSCNTPILPEPFPLLFSQSCNSCVVPVHGLVHPNVETSSKSFS